MAPPGTVHIPGTRVFVTPSAMLGALAVLCIVGINVFQAMKEVTTPEQRSQRAASLLTLLSVAALVYSYLGSR